jgi:hypothetical protein
LQHEAVFLLGDIDVGCYLLKRKEKESEDNVKKMKRNILELS